MRVLLVESALAVARKLIGSLAVQGLRTEMVGTGEDALELLRLYEFDIVVLNLTLPDMDGSKMVRRMRTARLQTPVLALSSRFQARQRVEALMAGADDVVDGNIDVTELVARMTAIIRRSRGYSHAVLEIGPVTLDLERREVLANGSIIPLTGKEFDILQLLMLRKNMVMTKEAILAQLYGGLDEPEPKIIDVFVCKIRRKLALAGLQNVIGTVWGRGYTIQDSSRDHYEPAPPRGPQPAQHRRPAFA
jgi:two-component system cell cycle response regulator CtrA